MIVLMNGERMMYNVFKDIPEVAANHGFIRKPDHYHPR
jgi:hypothetical protein